MLTILSRKGRKEGCIKERKKGRMYHGKEERYNALIKRRNVGCIKERMKGIGCIKETKKRIFYQEK